MTDPLFTPNDGPLVAAIDQACREVIAAYRLGRRIKRAVPVSVAALSLQVAVEDAEREMAS